MPLAEPARTRVRPIRHPGPAAADRMPFALGRAVPIDIPLAAGTKLTDAIPAAVEATGAHAAIVTLAGLELQPFGYVVPAEPPAGDDRHVAWYSETHQAPGTRLDGGTAVLGRRDGAWQLHIHAAWSRHGEPAPNLGHLLPETAILAADARITGYGIAGAQFDAAFDPETEFTIFRARSRPEETVARPDAIIATVAPHVDLSSALSHLRRQLCGDGPAEAMGLGSLISARFADGPDRDCAPIAEIFLDGALALESDTPPRPEVRAVDIGGRVWRGTLLPGTAPVLITMELLIVLRAPNP